MAQHSQVNLHGKNKNFREAYHEFHTERQETNHSIEYSTSRSLKNSRDSVVASTIEFHINNPIRELLHEFRGMLKVRGFKCIEIFQNQLYVVRMTTMDKLKKLFCCVDPPKYMLAIRTHEYRSPIQNPSLKTTSICTIQQAQSILHYLQTSTSLNKPLTNAQLSQLDSEYKQDIYSLDATSDYMFSRMLVDTNYSIGKRIQMVVNQFREKRSLEDLKFGEMVWINQAIGEVAQEMLQGFNCSRKELYEILGYCRKSIEAFIYNSLEQHYAENSMIGQKNTNSNKQLIPQKDNPLSDESIKNESFFITLYPVSIKILKNLMKTSVSIEIYERLFTLAQFIKIQTQNNKVSEQLKGDFLTWVKQEFGEKILTKLKALRAAGFMDRTFENFIKELRFEE